MRERRDPLAVTHSPVTHSPVTHSPCKGLASTPSVDYVKPGSREEGTTTILIGSGGIGGCPLVTTKQAESVSITVELQHFTGTWVTQASGSVTKGWNRYWRYARQAYVTLHAVCIPGEWRVRVTGGDGFAPTGWVGQSVTFTCQELSGAD
jgi:hypothetical protein